MKNIHQKWKYYREEKQNFEIYLIFFKKKFYKKDVLRNFAKFTGKHLFQGLFFHNVAGFAKFLRTPFLAEHLRRMLPKFEKNVG